MRYYKPLLITIGIAVLYRGVLADLAADWWNDPNYSHGLILPFITLWLIWRRKEELSSQVTERIFQEALKRGLLMMGYFPRMRLNPPLVITAAQVQEGIDILDEVFQCIADEVDYRDI